MATTSTPVHPDVQAAYEVARRLAPTALDGEGGFAVAADDGEPILEVTVEENGWITVHQYRDWEIVGTATLVDPAMTAHLAALVLSIVTGR